MNEVEVKCSCGICGWFKIQDEPYIIECPNCLTRYKINSDGVVEKEIDCE